MSIDPRIPTLPGRSTSGIHCPGRHRKHLARSAVRCPTSRMKGELHPTENRFVRNTGGVIDIVPVRSYLVCYFYKKVAGALTILSALLPPARTT